MKLDYRVKEIMKQLINKILAYPISKLTRLYFSVREQDYDKKSLPISKILKNPYILIYKIRFKYTLFNYIPYTHEKILITRRFISRIKKFYSKKLDEINYTIYTPKQEISFNFREKNFLKLVNTFPKFIFTNRNLSLFDVHTKPKHISCFKEHREVFSCVLKNVKFIGKSGAILHQGFSLVESASNYYRFNRVKVTDNFMKKFRKLKGFYTSIMHWDYLFNYYHFFIDNLPRLYAISKIRESKVYLIVPKYYSNFNLNIIKLFLNERFKIVRIEPDEVWELEKFFFPSFCSSELEAGYIPKFYLEFIKKRIFEKYRIKNNINNKRIYISREKAKSRRIRNENELFEILRKFNFEKVYTEDLSFREEVILFNSAEIIIAPMGAGLTNIIFSENPIVIELHPPKFIMAHYFMLCKALGFTYRYIIGYNQNEKYDFHVNLVEIKKMIEEII